DRNDNQHHDNANMSTPPDGYAPRMQMYAFTGATPNRDGSLDGEIILHEYTHGLSSRLIGGGAGIDALQTAGMGEGWSDFYALALLTDPASDVDGAYPIGAYVTQHGFGTQFEENYYYGIRSYPYCTDTNRNPLTFTDIDPARASAHAGVPRSPLAGAFNPSLAGEVHHQGEVWCMMLWEVRANLIRKHGGETGHNLTLQLVTEGLRLCPPNPNFVQARDAILLADRVLTQGANATEIWAAFTKRGLGYEAKAPNSYTTVGTQSSYTPAPALVIESVEVQGGNGNGIIETNEDNGLLIVVHNQGSSTATQVSAQISSSTPGVQILSAQSAYADIPQGQSRGNTVLLQIRTLPEFVDGTRIDVNVTLNSDQHTVTTTIPFYPGNSGPKLPPGGDNNLNNPTSDTASMKDLTPWDLGNLEPLWMAEDASCLLKAGTGKYVLWRPGADPLTIENPQFIAHRLTRHGVVVGAVNEPDTTDEAGNQVKHSWGAWWDFNANKPVPLTRTDGYTWPRNAGPLLNCGNVYSATLTNEFGYPLFITNVTSFPTLHDVWDMNSAGVSVGSLSMQETFAPQQILFDSLGAMTWFTPSERGLDAGRGSSPATQVNY
ncbi:MAG TPA: M36 family metallopeptidase, partial [Candidatus Paceibacterota bacterium]|nr:M36 family metallopeptidase [Candidatus Paceibacterota bacterium]